MSDSLRELATRWFEEVWNQQRLEAIHEIMTPECQVHLEGRELTGAGEFARYCREMAEALPGMRVTVEEVVVEGENAVVRWICRATYPAGELIPGEGRPVEFGGLTWLKFREEKIIESWDRWNQAGLYFRPDI